MASLVDKQQLDNDSEENDVNTFEKRYQAQINNPVMSPLGSLTVGVQMDKIIKSGKQIEVSPKHILATNMPIKDGAGNKNDKQNVIVFEFPKTVNPPPAFEE